MIDISAPIAPGSLPTWPGTPEPRFEAELRLDDGDPADDTTLHFSVHTGTHIDAPSHFVAGGKTVDLVPLDRLVGPCWVSEIRGVPALTARVLDAAGIPADTERLLVRTDNERRWGPKFDPDFVGFSLCGACWLVEHGIRLVGIDYLSVQPFRESNEVHRTLLRDEVVLLEGLQLQRAAAGRYVLVCLPLKLMGIEGAPARAILLPDGTPLGRTPDPLAEETA